MTQLSLKQVARAEPSREQGFQRAPDEVERLTRLVAEIRADAKVSPDVYLEQTIVPEGGE